MFSVLLWFRSPQIAHAWAIKTQRTVLLTTSRHHILSQHYCYYHPVHSPPPHLEKAFKASFVRYYFVKSRSRCFSLVEHDEFENEFDNDDRSSSSSRRSMSGYARPMVQWYPGHIAKAERDLSHTLKLVDVVVEVRDARILAATAHPKVATWCAGRPRLIAVTHGDQIPKRRISEWKSYFATQGTDACMDPLDRLTANQARQARMHRHQYSRRSRSSSSNHNSDSSNTRIGSDGAKINPSKNEEKEAEIEEATAMEAVLFVNGATGAGTPALKRAIIESGRHVQERRKARGLLPRPLRVCMIGYPNVGKSAILNKLIGVKRAPTSNRPGVTRSLQWIRVKDAEDFEVLDSPGVIPATLVNQTDATLLAACNCIGEAAYDNQGVAAFLCEWLLRLYRCYDGEDHVRSAVLGRNAAPEWPPLVLKRYKFDPLLDNELTGEGMLYKIAQLTCRGNVEDASRKVLQDFRRGRLGPICLQLPPESSSFYIDLVDPSRHGSDTTGSQWSTSSFIHINSQDAYRPDDRVAERARQAWEMAKDRGLELPVSFAVHQNKEEDGAPNTTDSSQVGKGLFEGW